MKKLLIFFVLLGIFSCKKKKEDPSEDPTPTPTPTPAHANVMSAKLNGRVWEVTGNKSSAADITISTYNSSPKQYVVTGRTQTYNRHDIYIGFLPVTGTHTFETFSNYYAAYNDSIGTGYFGKAGSITITEVDTSHKKSAVCDKLKATFIFTTTAIGSHSYIVEEGVIDFEAN
jgi:hypothetical protein